MRHSSGMSPLLHSGSLLPPLRRPFSHALASWHAAGVAGECCIHWCSRLLVAWYRFLNAGFRLQATRACFQLVSFYVLAVAKKQAILCSRFARILCLPALFAIPWQVCNLSIFSTYYESFGDDVGIRRLLPCQDACGFLNLMGQFGFRAGIECTYSWPRYSHAGDRLRRFPLQIVEIHHVPVLSSRCGQALRRAAPAWQLLGPEACLLKVPNSDGFML